MTGFSLKKRAGDTYVVCALAVLMTSVFAGTNTLSSSGVNKVVNAYLREETIFQMKIDKDQTYVFYTYEHINNENKATAYPYIKWNTNEFGAVIDINSKKELSLKKAELILVERKNAHLLQGPIVVQISGGFVDVIAEKSKHNYCSLMKPTNQTNWPLTCAPNYFRVLIEAV